MYEMLFHYFPAFVATPVDTSRVRIWLQHPKNSHINFDLSKTILVDLSKTPSNRSIDWDDVEVDDYEEHEIPEYRGFTSLGPVFPHNYGAAGVYISAKYRERHEGELKAALTRPENATLTASEEVEQAHILAGRPYEEWAVVRRKGKTITRFHGFHRVDTIARAIPPLPIPGPPPFPPILLRRELYLVAHAGASHTKRAPCPVIVSDSDLLDSFPTWQPIPRAGKGCSDSDGKPIYLSQKAAMVAGLDIPKKPTGSGEGLMVKREPDSTDDCLDPYGPLNVVDTDLYDEVLRIANRLQGNLIRVGRDNLFKRLPKKEDGPFTSLDLIGHSRGRDGLLRMNDLALGGGALSMIFTEPVIQRLVDLGISEIRLLGCRTATTAVAVKALQTLRTHLKSHGGAKISVRGTTADLFSAHYKQGSGLSETRLLASCEEGEPTPSIGPPTPIIRPDFKDFPLARDSSSKQKGLDHRYFHWANAIMEFPQLWDYFFDNGSDTTPFEESYAQVLFVDGRDVRAFDLIGAGPDEPMLSHIRLDFLDRWVKFPIRDNRASAEVLDLLKGRKSSATQS